MPTRRRSSYTFRMRNTSSPSTSTWPDTLAPLTKSIVRLMHFSSVVLPELAGPMIPKICPRGIVQRNAGQRRLRAVANGQVADLDMHVGRSYHFFRIRK